MSVIAPGHHVDRPAGRVQVRGPGHRQPQQRAQELIRQWIRLLLFLVKPPPPKNPERSLEKSGSYVPNGVRYLSLRQQRRQRGPTRTLSGRGERMRASGPFEREVSHLLGTNRVHR